MAFKNQLRVPPGGKYFYAVTDGDTTFRFTATSRVGLLTDVAAWYSSRGAETPKNLWDLCQAYMCRYLPRGFCYGADSGVEVGTPLRIKNRALPYLGAQVATPGSIRERLSTCVGCPQNDRSLCTTCTGLTAWALSGLRRGRIPMDDYVGVCKCDGLMVSVVASLMDPPTVEIPSGCWRMKNG